MVQRILNILKFILYAYILVKAQPIKPVTLNTDLLIKIHEVTKNQKQSPPALLELCLKKLKSSNTWTTQLLRFSLHNQVLITELLFRIQISFKQKILPPCKTHKHIILIKSCMNRALNRNDFFAATLIYMSNQGILKNSLPLLVSKIIEKGMTQETDKDLEILRILYALNHSFFF